MDIKKSSFQTAACRNCNCAMPEALILDRTQTVIVRCANEDHCALLLGGIRTVVNEQKRHGHRKRRGTKAPRASQEEGQ